MVQESGEGDCGVEQPSLRERPTNSEIYPRHMIGKRAKEHATYDLNPVTRTELLAGECPSAERSGGR
jgi:hypothetical protein